MPSVVQKTFIALSNGNGPRDITIPATTAGNTLLVWAAINTGGPVITVTATGASFTTKSTDTGFQLSVLVEAFNIGGGITTLTLNYAGSSGSQIDCMILEISGLSISDPWDGDGFLGGMFNTTDLGTALLTPTVSGFAMALFLDATGNTTNCVVADGWSNGFFNNNPDFFYESRNTVAGVQIGGATGQATSTGANNQTDSYIVSLKTAPPGGIKFSSTVNADDQWLGGDYY